MKIMPLAFAPCSGTLFSISVLLLALSACGSKPPADAASPTKATESAAADAKPDVPATPAGTSEAAAPASAAAAPVAPAKSDEPEISEKDPGDSGAFNLGAPHAKAVVEANKPFLNKSCWADAVKANPSGPSKVKVVIEAEVTPDGKVTKVALVGGKEYPNFAECVKKHVTRWKWPKAKSTSSVMFPMEFSHGDVQWREKEKR
jgi:hypothetical protein